MFRHIQESKEWTAIRRGWTAIIAESKSDKPLPGKLLLPSPLPVFSVRKVLFRISDK